MTRSRKTPEQQPVVERVPVAPLLAGDTWHYREVGLVGEASEAVFAPFAHHAEGTDFVIVNRADAEPVIMLSTASWHRVLATVARASGDLTPKTVAIKLVAPV